MYGVLMINKGGNVETRRTRLFAKQNISNNLFLLLFLSSQKVTYNSQTKIQFSKCMLNLCPNAMYGVLLIIRGGDVETRRTRLFAKQNHLV
jgi:hypothetical protein